MSKRRTHDIRTANSQVAQPAPRPRKRRKLVRKFFLLLLLVTGLVVCLVTVLNPAATVGPIVSPKAYTVEVPGTPQPPFAVVSAKSIGADYESNKIAAERKWTGKRVQITSKVTSISDGWTGSTVSFGEITGKAFSLMQIVCRGASDDQLATLAEGRQATVRGVLDGDMTLGVLDLNECEIVK
jgi:hypothetical protein